jgi:hypothetical protein
LELREQPELLLHAVQQKWHTLRLMLQIMNRSIDRVATLLTGASAEATLCNTAVSDGTAPALGVSQDQLPHGVFVDCGCTKTIFKDEHLLVNVRKLKQPVRNNRVAGSVLAHWATISGGFGCEQARPF